MGGLDSPGDTETAGIAIPATTEGERGSGDSSGGAIGKASEGATPAGGPNKGFGTEAQKNASARTTSERLAGLDQELAEALSQFDGFLLDKNSEIESRRSEEKRRTDIDYEVSGKRNAGGGSAQSSRGGATNRGDSDDDASQGGSSGGYAGGLEEKQENANAQDPMIDGSDDDIVARQLREAAEQEKNPALRERLWREYRDYKASSGGGAP